MGQNVTEVCQPNIVEGKVLGIVCSNIPVNQMFFKSFKQDAALTFAVVDL